MLFLYTVLCLSFVSADIVLKRVPSRNNNNNKKIITRNDLLAHLNISTVRRQNMIDRFLTKENETDVSEPLNYDFKDPWWKTIRTAPNDETVNIYKTLLTKTEDKRKKTAATKTTTVQLITKFNTEVYFKDVIETIKEANIVRSQNGEPKYESLETDINKLFPKETKEKLLEVYKTPHYSNAKFSVDTERTKPDPLINLDPMMLLNVAVKNINASNIPSMHRIFIDMPISNYTYTKDKIEDLNMLNDSLNKLAQYYNFTAHHYGTSDLDALDLKREGKEPETNATIVEVKIPSTQTIPVVRTQPVTTTDPTTKVVLTPTTPPSTTRDPNDTRTFRPLIPPMATETDMPGIFSDHNRLTIPPHLLDSSTAEKPSKFMQAAQMFMSFYKVGYFSAFLVSLFETLASKPDNIAHLIFVSATHEYDRLKTEEQYFQTLGETITDSLKKLVTELKWLPLEYTKAKILVLRFIAESRREATSAEVNSIIDYIDTLFQESEGRALIKSVEVIKNYPNVSGNIYDVLKNMSDAVFTPLVRLAGTQKKQYLIDAIEKQLRNGTTIFPKEMFYGFRRFNNGTRFKIVGRDILLNDTKRPDITDEDLEKDVTNKETTTTVTPKVTTTIRITKLLPEFLTSTSSSKLQTTKFISKLLPKEKKILDNMNIIRQTERTRSAIETTPARFKIISRTTAKKRIYEDDDYDDNHIVDKSVSEPCKYGQDINFKYERARNKHNLKKKMKHFKQKHHSIYKKLKKYKKKMHKKKGKHDRKYLKKHKHGNKRQNNHEHKRKKGQAKKLKSDSAQIRNKKSYDKNENVRFSTYEEELSESQLVVTSSQQLDLLNKEFQDTLSDETLSQLKAGKTNKSFEKDFSDYISDATKTALVRDKEALRSSERKTKDKWGNNNQISNVKINDTGSTSFEDLSKTTIPTVKSTAYLKSSSESGSSGSDVWSGPDGDVSSEFVESTLRIPTTGKAQYTLLTFNSLKKAIAAKARTANLVSSTTTTKVITPPKKSGILRSKWEMFMKNKLMNKNIAAILKKFKYDINRNINRNETENVRKWVKVDVLTDYSDDEESLRTNLLDAIRHGDVNFRARRKFDDKPIYKATKKFDKFSSYSSEEIVLKSNIYKVIGFKGGKKVPTKKRSKATPGLMALRARTEKIDKIKPINEMSSYSDDEEILKERIKKTNFEYMRNFG